MTGAELIGLVVTGAAIEPVTAGAGVTIVVPAGLLIGTGLAGLVATGAAIGTVSDGLGAAAMDTGLAAGAATDIGGATTGRAADMATDASGGTAGGGFALGSTTTAGGATTGALSPKAVSCRAPQVNTKKNEKSSAPASMAPLDCVDSERMALGGRAEG